MRTGTSPSPSTVTWTPCTLPELYTRLGRAAHRNGDFQLRFQGAGTFGGRALWAGASGGLPPMRRLADSASAAARRAGVAMTEHRAYTPHLTLARDRTGAADLPRYAAALADPATPPMARRPAQPGPQQPSRPGRPRRPAPLRDADVLATGGVTGPPGTRRPPTDLGSVTAPSGARVNLGTWTRK